MATIETIKIHPAIGIAQVANGPTEFLGPELPGQRLRAQVASISAPEYSHGP